MIDQQIYLILLPYLDEPRLDYLALLGPLQDQTTNAVIRRWVCHSPVASSPRDALPDNAHSAKTTFLDPNFGRPDSLPKAVSLHHLSLQPLTAQQLPLPKLALHQCALLGVSTTVPAVILAGPFNHHRDPQPPFKHGDFPSSKRLINLRYTNITRAAIVTGKHDQGIICQPFLIKSI